MTDTSGIGTEKIGNLEVRLASSDKDRDDVQALRYRVFYGEMGAKPTDEMRKKERDFDDLDNFCEHLMVIDTERADDNKVIGTYRLIRRETAKRYGSFYSEGEYDIAPLIQYPGEILELGRSCIDAEYRTKAVMQILWRGLASYIIKHNISLMFGCASLPGTDAKALAVPLSYLYHHHLAPPGLRTRALPERYVDMNMLPKEAFDPDAAFNDLKMDPRTGGNSLPPLIKGYLRVGGYVGDGAVVDDQFNTTDVSIIVKTDLISDRYTRHYNLDAQKDVNLP